MSELGGSVGRLGPGGNLGPGGRMHHSHSTPAGVDGGSRTPPATPQKGGKMLAVRVQMLDDSVTMFQIQAKALGRVLFEQVCRQLHLLEADYFGLEYQEPNGTKYWLDLEKAVCRQVGLSLVEPVLKFCVKFYTPDPAQLEEEFTRYLFCLQIKRDLAQGIIQCNDNTAALMASYIVQAECGDYVSEDYPDHTYLSSYRFVPQQDQTLERRIMENHKKHAGQTPAEADLNLLETARRCELYGMKMHSAKDHEGVPLNLAVAHMGIVVFQHTTKINTFSWAKIRKISFKRKRFLVKLHPEGYGYYKDTVEFFFEGRNECKNFWKKCVENHGFFRCSAVKHVPRHKTRVLSRGSSFRYSGKTQKQIVEFVRDNYVKRQTFQRSQSFRHSSAVLAGPGSGTTSIGIVNNSVNASVSAHPLLPLADPVELASRVQPWNLTPVSQTTREACLPRSTHTGYTVGPGVTAALVEPPPNIRMMSSPSPPLTTRSGSPVTSATWSPPEAHRAHSPHAEVVPDHQRVTAAMDSPCKPSGQNHNLYTTLIHTHNRISSINHSATHIPSASCPVATHSVGAVAGSASAVVSTPHMGQPSGCIIHTAHTVHHPYVPTTPATQTPLTITPTSRASIPSLATTPTVAIVPSSDLFHSTDRSEGRNSYSLPRNAELGNEYSDSLTWDTYNQTLSLNNISDSKPLGGRVCTGKPKHKKSSERLEYELSHANMYSTTQYKNIGDISVPPAKRHIWQRSASCRDLYDFSFEETGQAKHRNKNKNRTNISTFDREFLSFNRIDSPITRYDDSHRIMYSSKNNSVDVSQDFILPELKVYSSSYPGTASYISTEEPPQFELLSNSHDDVSHDSYELLERSDEDTYYRIRRSRSDAHTRSCSLDSGNYLPSDDSVSESECKYRSALDVKYRSAVDMQNDIFLMDDPRDLPREKMCVKSDGSFYKDIKKTLGSRTSSQESRSDYYDSKMSKSSPDSSKKSRDSLYHTDSKKSRETLKSKSSDRSGYNSRTSSQESKSECCDYKKPDMDFSSLNKTTNKIEKKICQSKTYDYTSRNSSQESKSDYYDAKMSQQSLDKPFSSNVGDEFGHDYSYSKQKVKSHDSLLSELKANQKSNYYDPQTSYSTIPCNGKHKETSHVHSISLQNVETEQHMRAHTYKKAESEKQIDKRSRSSGDSVPRKSTTTHIWPESIAGICTEIIDGRLEKAQSYRKRSPENENIFSFDKDKIESLTSTDKTEIKRKEGNGSLKTDKKSSPEYPVQTTVLQSEFDKLQIDSPSAKSCNKKDTRKEDLIAKTHFDEYNPKMIIDPGASSQQFAPLTYTHPTVERTKSDPNSLANRPRMGSNSRKHVLMHQKSIDLTPADSSDEEYIYRQIPSAPPVCKTHGHFDLPKSPYDIPPDIAKTAFELPKSYFKEFDERKYPFEGFKPIKIEKDLTKVDIPYVLHKRHLMNGTVPTPPERHKPKPRSPKSPKDTMNSFPVLSDVRNNGRKNETLPVEYKENKLNVSLDLENEPKGFLFTQNIDLSKVDPITLEIDKTSPVVQHVASPKRDITKIMDPILLEALNSKLSQIESDSATSSKTESLHPEKKKYTPQIDIKEKVCEHKMQVHSKVEVKSVPKRVIKPRMQPTKKVIKTKTKAKIRITSFSSDDESLDSDDVFGSAEATPTRLEFSPPQSRKDIEPILRIEYDKITSGIWTRGQTMSSTEIEGSPPQCRRLVELENRYSQAASLEPVHTNPTELRRISERSISIPSSEDDANLQCQKEEPATISTQGYHTIENIPSPILESCELLRTDEEMYETCLEDRQEADDIAYTLTKNISEISQKITPIKDTVDNIEVNLKHSDLKLSPSKSKLIDELKDSPLILRKKGQTTILFAHARLNLSEGSAFASLQRQKATLESPTSGRRAKSLDTPVISLHRLPPMNAFSSKDDTVDFNEEGEILEEKSIDDNTSIDFNVLREPTPVLDEVLNAVKIDDDEAEMINKLVLVQQVRPNLIIKSKSKNRKSSKFHHEKHGRISPDLQPRKHLHLGLKKSSSENKTFDVKVSPKKPTPEVIRTKSHDAVDIPKLQTQRSLPTQRSPINQKGDRLFQKENKKSLLTQKSLPTQKSLSMKERNISEVKRSKSQEKTLTTQSSFTLELKTNNHKDRPDKLFVPDMKRTKSQEIELVKRSNSKEKSKSIEKLEIKRLNSKERSKSQEESEADIAKRKAKQQQLYESAMKQTITMISPVKDFVPAFPAPEDKISVTTDGDKIIIETDIRSKAEDHVFIAKSPKKLDTKLTKVSKSFEEIKSVDKLPKLNKSFDDRAVSKSFEETRKFERSTKVEEVEKSPGKISRSQELKQQIEGKVVHKKIDIKSKSLEQNANVQKDIGNKSKSLEKYENNETSPDSDSASRQKIVTVDVHQLQTESDFESDSNKPRISVDSDKSMEERVILHGTSLDVWLTMSENGYKENLITHTIVNGESFLNNSTINTDVEEVDTQAVIQERRKLDILKRQSIKSEEDDNESVPSPLHQSEDVKILTKLTSEEESLTEISDIKVEACSDDSGTFVVHKADEVSEIQKTPIDEKLLSVEKNDSLRKLSIERSRSEDTGSWMTVDYEEYIGGTDDLSTYDQTDIHEVNSLEKQNTLEDINVKLYTENNVEENYQDDNDKISDYDEHYSNIIITPPQDISPVVENNSLPESVADFDTQNQSSIQLSSTETKSTEKRNKGDFLRLNIERSKSSDTTGSWTSGEKDVSPSRTGLGERQDSSPCSSREKGSLDEESSVSCSISRPLGISQDIDKFDRIEKLKCKQLRDSMLDIEEDTLTENITQTAKHSEKPAPIDLNLDENIKTSTKKVSTPTLEKQYPVDLESGSEVEELNVTEKRSNFEKFGKGVIEESESSSSGSSSQLKVKTLKPNDCVHKRVCRNPRIELTMSTDSNTESEHTNGRKFVAEILLKTNDINRSSLESKSSMESKSSLSVESRGSFETESSSGSLGAAHRRGELAQIEQQSTWRPFLIESSGSSSLEEGWIPPDQDTYECNVQPELYDFSNQRGIDDFQTFASTEIKPVEQKDVDVDFQDDLNDFPTNFGYPCVTSGIGIGINPSDMLVGYSSTFALGRTLSRISERSTNSEKSSIDEDSTKASSHSNSVHDESVISSDHQASLSSDPPSHTNIAYISDTDRRTSAEMPDIPSDFANADKISQMYAIAMQDDPNVVKTGRFSVTQVSEEEFVDKKTKHLSASNGSQDSEDWPLPEIPLDPKIESDQVLMTVYKVPMSDRPIPKSFCWKSQSIRSQDSENWPSPPSSALDTPIVESIETYYLDKPERALQVMVDSYTDHTPGDDSGGSDESDNMTLNNDDIKDELKDEDKLIKSEEILELESDNVADALSPSNKTSSITTARILPYEETTYLMPTKSENEDSCLSGDILQYDRSSSCLATTLSSASCLSTTFDVSSCCASNKSSTFVDPSSLLDTTGYDKVIVAQPTRSPQNHSPTSEEDPFANDDVFSPGTVKIEICPDSDKLGTELFQHKYSHGSNNSDTSIDDMLSTFMDETVKRNLEPRVSTGSCKKCSHSSHSEEETSSLGTDLDGTVKLGIQPKRCTHSSHSEDTSVGLSISEWSTGTNTVRQYANLSGSDSLSAVSNVSLNKSEKSSANLTKSSEFSSNLSSSGFKSSESLSGSRRELSLENLPEDIRYDTLTNSDTNERVSSKSSTKSDDTTLTLTEMAQTISEWSTSTSNTLIAQGSEDSVKNGDSFKYKPLKESEIKFKSNGRVEKQSPDKPEKSIFRNSVQFTTPASPQNIPSEDLAKKKSPDKMKSLECSLSHLHTKSTERPVKIPVNNNEKLVNKRQSLEKLSARYKSQNEDSFSEKLYGPEEKLSARYQSQEFKPSRSDLFEEQYKQDPYDKPLVKHHSYDDKTLSKHQIREYKNARIGSRSQSFHEHLFRATDYPPLPDIANVQPPTTETVQLNKTEHPGKLSKTTTYYSSSLSSESPPIQIQKPPRKPSIPRSVHPRSPPSGNDTDSSLDFIQDPKARRGYRRKPRQVPAKRSRLDKTKEQGNTRLEVESSECSEGYFPEIESGSSDMSKVDFNERIKYPDFDEEPEGYPEYLDVEEKYPGSNEPYSGIERKEPYPGIDDYYPGYTPGFDGLDFPESVDEMGFPIYDRLGSLQHSYLKEMSQPSSSKTSKSEKSVKSKKRQLKREESIACKELDDHDYRGVQYTPDESGNEIKAGLSDDVCYSSEDSFAAGYCKPPLMYQQYSSDTGIPQDYFADISRYATYTDSERSLDGSEPFDISNLPPPLLTNPDEDLSDENI